MSLKLIFFPFSLALILFISIFLIKPEITKMNKIKSEIQSKEQTLKAIDDNVKKFEQASRELESSEKQQIKALIENAIPYEEQGGELLQQIYEKIILANVMVTKIAFSGFSDNCGDGASVEQMDLAGTGSASGAAPAAKICLKSAKIKVDLAGSYEQIKGFILEVEKMNRYTEIKELSIARPDQQFSEEQLAVDPDLSQRLNSTLEFEVFQKELPDNFNVASYKDSEAYKILLQGTYSTDVVSAFSKAITDRAAQTVEMSNIQGKENLFSAGGAVPQNNVDANTDLNNVNNGNQ
jgi:hypothetical protein